MEHTKPMEDDIDQWRLYVEQLNTITKSDDPILVDDDDTDNVDHLAKHDLKLDRVLKKVEDQYFIFNENLNTDASFKRRLESGLHFMNCTSDAERDEYAFFYANLDSYSDDVKEMVYPKLKGFRDLLDSICTAISPTN